MSPHLEWKEIDAYARGLLEGPAEVHLAECGECAAKLAKLREEEEVLRAALEPGEVSDEAVEAAASQALSAPRPRRSSFSILPLAAAAVLVLALVAVLAKTTPVLPEDPMGDALAANNRARLQEFGRKAAAHAPAALASELRALPPRVLYVEGGPRMEYRMLRKPLLEDGGLLVHTMLLSSREPEVYGKSEALPSIATMFPLDDRGLNRYDVIVLGEVRATRLASTADVFHRAMESFVARLGGTLVVIAGPDTGPESAARALDRLLPVDLSRAKEASADAAVASQALAASGVIRWRLDAPVREGTVVMATEKGAPVIVERRAGRGRVVWVASDDFWHWGTARQFALYRALLTQ
jgi:hypothetical protein